MTPVPLRPEVMVQPDDVTVVKDDDGRLVGYRVALTVGLTETEDALCHQLGQCYLDFRAILYASDPDSARGRGLSDAQQQDLREFVAHIHDLQHAVMARAAIRLHPELYRP